MGPFGVSGCPSRGCCPSTLVLSGAVWETRAALGRKVHVIKLISDPS